MREPFSLMKPVSQLSLVRLEHLLTPRIINYNPQYILFGKHMQVIIGKLDEAEHKLRNKVFHREECC